MPGTVEKKLADLGIILGTPAAPVANYVGFVRTGNLLVVSGQLCFDGEGKLVFTMSEISESLGRAMTPHIFEISTSTHYGRMVMVDDDTVVCFGDMNEAMAYIEH